MFSPSLSASRILVALLVVSLLSASTRASAQAIADEPIEGRFHLGPLRFTPSILISDIGVDNNVFNELDDPKRDTTAAFGPQVALWLRAGKSRLSGSVSGQYLYFRTYADQRSWNSNDTALFDIPLNRIRPFVGGSYLNSRARPGFEVDARARRRDVTAHAGTDVRLTAKTTFVLTGSQKNFNYDEDAPFLGVDLSAALDHRSHSESLQLRYAMTPLTTFVVTADGTQDRFDHGSVRNADSVRVMPGFEFKPFALISGKAAVGYRHFNILKAGTPDFDGVIAAVDARYVLRATQFAVRINRDVDYSFEETTPYYSLTDAGLEITQRITQSWDVLLRGSRQSLAYRYADSETTSDRRVDHGTAYGAGLHYHLGDAGSVGIDANYYSRASLSAPRNYEGLRIGASMSYGAPQ